MQYDFIDHFVLGFFIRTILKEKIHVSHVAFEFLDEIRSLFAKAKYTYERVFQLKLLLCCVRSSQILSI
jgi:hypothetical protein